MSKKGQVAAGLIVYDSHFAFKVEDNHVCIIGISFEDGFAQFSVIEQFLPVKDCPDSLYYVDHDYVFDFFNTFNLLDWFVCNGVMDSAR